MGINKKSICPGTGSPPKKVTMAPKGKLSGYGICSKCNSDSGLTSRGNMIVHKVR